MLHRAEFAGIGCMKQHAAFVFMTDRILQQCWAEHAASMEKRDESVLQSWCDDDEPADVFLSRANRFLRTETQELSTVS